MTLELFLDGSTVVLVVVVLLLDDEFVPVLLVLLVVEVLPAACCRYIISLSYISNLALYFISEFTIAPSDMDIMLKVNNSKIVKPHIF